MYLNTTISPQKASGLIRKHGLRLPDVGDYVELPNGSTLTRARCRRGRIYYRFIGDSDICFGR